MLPPTIAPMTAPTAVAAVFPSPLPNWLPTTAPATPPMMDPAVSFSPMPPQPERAVPRAAISSPVVSLRTRGLAGWFMISLPAVRTPLPAFIAAGGAGMAPRSLVRETL